MLSLWLELLVSKISPLAIDIICSFLPFYCADLLLFLFLYIGNILPFRLITLPFVTHVRVVSRRSDMFNGLIFSICYFRYRFPPALATAKEMALKDCVFFSSCFVAVVSNAVKVVRNPSSFIAITVAAAVVNVVLCVEVAIVDGGVVMLLAVEAFFQLLL